MPRSVLLPEPEGPKRATSSPVSLLRSTPSTATRVPLPLAKDPAKVLSLNDSTHCAPAGMSIIAASIISLT